MTDARREWISKRAYSIWEEVGRPHGHDAEHWQQATQERDEFERVALAPEGRPTAARKPLIEISRKMPAKKAEAAKPKKTLAKAKSTKADAGSKPI